MDRYVPDIEDDFEREVIYGALGDCSVEFMLGALLDQEEFSIMSVMLLNGGSFLNDCDGLYDLRFGIRRRSIEHAWRVSPIDFSQSTVGRFIRREDRGRVLRLLLEAVTCLAREVRPRVVTGLHPVSTGQGA